MENHPLVELGRPAKDLIGKYGQWKTVNLWDDPAGWVLENLDISIFILTVWAINKAVTVGAIGWFGYSFYTALTTDGEIPYLV